MTLYMRYFAIFSLLLDYSSAFEVAPDCRLKAGCASSRMLAAPTGQIDVSEYTFSSYIEAQHHFFPVQADSEPPSPSPPRGGRDVSDSQRPCPSRPMIMAYYPDWVGDSFPPDRIDFGRIDWIDFAFAVPESTLGLTWDDPRAPDLLNKTVVAAHAQGKKVKLSIGGWTGSRYFSFAVSSDDNRRLFATNILTVYTAYELDGIDIDWEYPGSKGDKDNQWNVNDTDNFLLFLKMLRLVLPVDARISAAVATMPFFGKDGKPMTDVKEFAKVLDWVLLMNYDVWGSSSKPGPNAPLRDGCRNSTQPESSAVAAFTSWTSAGFPACQLVLGLPSYGYISSSTSSRLRTRVTAGVKPKKSKTKRPSGIIKITNEDGATIGQVQFKDLLHQGAIKRSNSTATNDFVGGNGFQRHWDVCSDTPFLRSRSMRQVISYDDPESLSLKAAFARDAGMLGVNFFDIHGDTDDWVLIDAARIAFGAAILNPTTPRGSTAV